MEVVNTPTELFESFQLGPITLPNRLVMAPMTRCRAAEPGMVASPLSVKYYRQRASAGLLITEASQISQQGYGFQGTPGIHSKEQVAAWQRVTEAVHASGEHIFIQIWHMGRIGRSSLQPGGSAPVAPSAIRAPRKTRVNGTYTDVSEPRALELFEIPGIIEDFRRAAANAIEAGFDGVEIHGANGYLLDQFAKDGANRRGIRISPLTPLQDGNDSNPQALFGYIVDHLNALKLIYIHVIEGVTGGQRDIAPFNYTSLRQRFKQVYIANNGYDFELASNTLDVGAADLIAFGKPFISNPDLVERLKRSVPLNEWNEATFYGGGAEGYTDYPILGAPGRPPRFDGSGSQLSA